jgi:hypothetical protein
VTGFPNLQRASFVGAILKRPGAYYVKYSTCYVKYSPYLIGKYTFLWLGAPMILRISEATHTVCDFKSSRTASLMLKFEWQSDGRPGACSRSSG